MRVSGPEVVVNQNRQGRRLPDLGIDTGCAQVSPPSSFLGTSVCSSAPTPTPGFPFLPPHLPHRLLTRVGGKTVSWPPGSGSSAPGSRRIEPVTHPRPGALLTEQPTHVWGGRGSSLVSWVTSSRPFPRFAEEFAAPAATRQGFSPSFPVPNAPHQAAASECRQVWERRSAPRVWHLNPVHTVGSQHC